MSYEVRIGILALIAISISLWGIKFIQGQNLLSKSDVYYAYFNDVGGIQIGTPVQISGVTVGSVANIDLGIEDRRVRLSLDLEQDVPLPKDARAILATTSFLGDKAVLLDYDRPCTGEGDCAQSGDTLVGLTQGMVESVLGEGGVEAYIETFKDGLEEILDTLNQDLLGEDSSSPVAQTARDLESTMSNLKAATARTNQLLQRTSPELEKALANVSDLTETLAAQRDNIAGIIANADSLSQQLVDAQLDEAIEQVKGTITELEKTLETTNTAMGGVSDVITKIENGEGTLGKLVNDEALYHNLNALSRQMDSLVTDINQRPYRYIPLKGRRKINRYDSKDESELPEQ